MTWFKEKSSKPYASTRKVNVRICHNFLPVQYTSEPTQFKGLDFNELKLPPPLLQRYASFSYQGRYTEVNRVWGYGGGMKIAQFLRILSNFVSPRKDKTLFPPPPCVRPMSARMMQQT